MSASVAMGVGHAVASSPGAASTAAHAAREALRGAPARAALLLLPYRGVAHRKIAREVCDALGDVPLVGATTYGEIAHGSPMEGEIVVALIGGDDVHGAAALGSGLGSAPHRVAKEA